MNDDLKGFAIEPKRDCPHLQRQEVEELIQFLTKVNNKHFSQFQCQECKDKTENWICLQCKQLFCSRYVNSHMVAHNSSTKHPIALSFSDSSFWCYECDSYIDDPSLIRARKEFSKSKFAAPLGGQEETEESKLLDEMEKLQIKKDEKEEKKFTYEEIISGMKQKKYTKIVLLTGAGLSVGAGIPDFRSPKTGLYSKLQEYNLPRPEAVFDIDFFKKNPAPFLKLAKQFLNGEFNPTDGHRFIKKLQDENMLFCNLTQNIDDLQIKVGITDDKLIQAHGHSRSAHCIKCKKEASMQSWVKALEKEQPLLCESCQGYVKPDIVFFGQALPQKFYMAPKIVEEADLVFIIGTSLAVMPFAFMATMIKEETPIVLVNNTDSLAGRSKVWLDGDIQENINKIAKDLDWKL